MTLLQQLLDRHDQRCGPDRVARGGSRRPHAHRHLRSFSRVQPSLPVWLHYWPATKDIVHRAPLSQGIE